MISNMEKRVLAAMLALFLFITSIQTSTFAVQAEEKSQPQKAVLNEEMQTTVRQDVQTPRYEFVPEETGTYCFYSVASGDTYGSLYGASGELLCSDNDSGEEFGFRIEAGLNVGESYYLEAGYFLETTEGTILWKIEKMPEKEALQEDAAGEPQDESKEQPDTENSAEQPETAAKEAGEPLVQENSPNAAEAESGTYQYETLSDNTVEITKYTGEEATVSIPAQLDGKNVSSIGQKAFAENATITAVTIPNTVTKTQYKSFYSCSNLISVDFAVDSKLETIGEGSFLSCKNLEGIVFQESMRTVEDYAFESCEKLKSVTLNQGLSAIGNSAFYRTGITSINLVDSITKMGTDVFSSCTNLSSVIIGKGLKGIENNTFYYCRSLKSITIPSNITYIGDFAFYSTGLAALQIPDSVTSIGAAVFMYCNDLKSAVISNNLAYISESAFFGCGLENITIGKKVKKIGDYAFQSNRSLKNIQIPSNVTELEYAVFRDCTSLATIIIPDTLEKINGHTFDRTAWYAGQPDGIVYTGKVLYDYKGNMPANTTVTVQNGTLGIAGYAFEDDVNLTECIIPEGVTNIGEGAFIGCTAMKTITIPRSVTEIQACALGFVKLGYQYTGPSYPKAPLSSDYQTTEEWRAAYDEYLVKVKEYQEAWQAYREERKVYEEYDPETYFYNGMHSISSLEKIEGFTIYGENGSAAQAYAAKYEIPFVNVKNTHTVTFMDGNKVISTQTIVSGQNANPPKLTKAGYSLNWDKSYQNVREDLTIHAVWTKTTASQTISVKKTFQKAYGDKAFNLNAKHTAGDGKLTYVSSNKKVATVNSNGKVTIKGTGATVITVKAAATKKYEETKVKVTILVSPKAQAVKTLKVVKGKKVTVKWKKDTRATGYQIQYSTDKKFKKNVQTKLITKQGTTSKTLSKLKKGKKYYVRIRAYKSAKVDGKNKKLYGKYSSAKLSGKVK